MADTLTFSLVSPEQSLASGSAAQVQIPSADGDLTAMAGHAPLITTLRPGVLHVSGPDGDDDYVVSGGFAEISAEGVTVLAERALHQKDMTQEIFSDWVADVKAAHEVATGDAADAAAKVLADMVAVGGHIGLNAD